MSAWIWIIIGVLIMAGLLVSIRRGISIEGALPNAQAGVSVAATLTADGAQYGADWTMTGTLPPGWEVAYNGTTATVTGVATTAGDYTVTFSVVDGRSYRASRTFHVRIAEADELMATDGTLIAPRDRLGPVATVGEAYFCQITPVGGVPPYSWTHVSGSLAVGLSFNTSNGEITGTPSSPDVSSAAHYTLTDSASNSIAVVLQPFVINMSIVGSPPAGVRGKPYSFQFKAQGGFQHSWSVSSGTLPSGMILDPSGELRGVPEVTTEGTTVTVKCDSLGGASVTKSVTIVVSEATITVKVETPRTATVGGEFELLIYSSGWHDNYRADVRFRDVGDEDLPAGFEIMNNSYLRPRARIFSYNVPAGSVGQYTPTIRVSDPFGNYKDAPITINVVVGPLSLQAQDEGEWSGKVGSSFNKLDVKVVNAVGGLSPFTWAVDSGTVPPGLTLSEGGSYTYLQGTPTTAGTYSFVVSATDSQSPADNATALIKVVISR